MPNYVYEIELQPCNHKRKMVTLRANFMAVTHLDLSNVDLENMYQKSAKLYDFMVMEN